MIFELVVCSLACLLAHSFARARMYDSFERHSVYDSVWSCLVRFENVTCLSFSSGFRLLWLHHTHIISKYTRLLMQSEQCKPAHIAHYFTHSSRRFHSIFGSYLFTLFTDCMMLSVLHLLTQMPSIIFLYLLYAKSSGNENRYYKNHNVMK